MKLKHYIKNSLFGFYCALLYVFLSKKKQRYLNRSYSTIINN